MKVRAKRGALRKGKDGGDTVDERLALVLEALVVLVLDLARQAASARHVGPAARNQEWDHSERRGQR